MPSPIALRLIALLSGGLLLAGCSSAATSSAPGSSAPGSTAAGSTAAASSASSSSGRSSGGFQLPTKLPTALPTALPSNFPKLPDVDLRKVLTDSLAALNRYWDESHRKTAIPGGPKAPTGSSPTGSIPVPSPAVVVPPTVGALSSAPVGASSAGALFPAPGLAGRTSGRLYFVQHGNNYVCSATVVNSTSQDIVATAGHCVWDTETGSGWGSKYLFIPDDSHDGQTAPYGRWVATRLYTTTSFKQTARATDAGVSGAGWSSDSAFLKLAPLNGLKIQQVTGGQGIAFGAKYTSAVVVGYPSAKPFDGTSERYCSSDAVRASFYGLAITCAMTPGSSGGAWLTSYNRTSGAGTLVGVTSLGNEVGTPFNSTALLGTEAYTAYLMAIAGK